MISFADFEMKADRAGRNCLIFKMLEENSPYSTALGCGFYGKQQQFGFVRDESRQSEAQDLFIRPRQREPDAGQRQQAGALSHGPGFAEARIETVLHYRHNLVQIIMSARAENDLPPGHVIGLASGPRP